MPSRMVRIKQYHALKLRSPLDCCLGKKSQNPGGKYSLSGVRQGAIRGSLKGKFRPSNIPQETTMIEIMLRISLPSLSARNLNPFSLGGVR